ncbi:EAL domain-containing protein, partial [Vibrio artabrorum]
MLGFAENGDVTCATEGPTFDLNKYSMHKISNGLKLLVAEDNNELLLVKESGTKQIFASITPLSVEYLEEARCIECFSYKLIIESKPIL